MFYLVMYCFIRVIHLFIYVTYLTALNLNLRLEISVREQVVQGRYTEFETLNRLGQRRVKAQ